jgi:protein SCO1/2
VRAQGSQTASPAFNEELGEIVPGDIEVILDDGRKVQLSQLIDRPTILSMVYCECPGICTPLLNEICDVLGKSGTGSRSSCSR